MTKKYCDRCNAELKDNSGRILKVHSKGHLPRDISAVEITVSANSKFGGPQLDLCHPCLESIVHEAGVMP